MILNLVMPKPSKTLLTPQKTNILKPTNEGLEDDLPFHFGVFIRFHISFRGELFFFQTLSWRIMPGIVTWLTWLDRKSPIPGATWEPLPNGPFFFMAYKSQMLHVWYIYPKFHFT